MDELSVKVRKPYTIKKERERWTCEEHDKFLEGIKLYGRAWRKIQDHIGTKNTIQIRSHAQKFFSKVVCDPNTGKAIEIPPPRPKRKPLQPYPRKNVKLPLKEGKKKLNFNSDQENGSPVSILPSLNPSNDNDNNNNNSNHNSEDNSDNNMKRGEQDNFGCESHRTPPEEENNNGSAEKSDMESNEEPKDEVHAISKQCCISEQVSQNETLSSLNSSIQNPNPLPVWPPVLPLPNIPWWWGPYTSIPNYSMFINPNVPNIENNYNAPKMEAPLKFGEESNLSSFEDSGPIRFELKLSENSAFVPVKSNKGQLIKGFIPYIRD